MNSLKDRNQAFWWLPISMTQKSARNRKKQKSEGKLINIQWLFCILTEKKTPSQFGDSSHNQYSSLQLPAKQIITDPNSSPSLYISMLWQTPRNRPSQSQGVRKNTVSETCFQRNLRFAVWINSLISSYSSFPFRTYQACNFAYKNTLFFSIEISLSVCLYGKFILLLKKLCHFNATLLWISGRKVEVMTVFDPISRPFFSLLSPVVTECINSQTFSVSSFQCR